VLKGKYWTISLTLVFFILGLLLSLQFRTQRLLASSLEAQKTEDLVAMWKNLSTKRNQLHEEIAQLQQQLFTLRAGSGADNDAVAALEEELAWLRINTGLAPVKGPGITVTITGDSPLLYEDLVDIVNELWASGAEAIAINKYRIGTFTAIADKEEGAQVYITVNSQKLLYPIVIKAIGDPHTLEKGLTFTGGLIESLRDLFIYPNIKKEQDLQLPAVTPHRWQYARPQPPADMNKDKNNTQQ